MEQTSSNSIVVACLGSSSTAAKGSYDWIGDLQSRRRNASLRFLNFGVGGDLAYNALHRLPELIQRRADMVVILIGANDVLSLTFRKLRRFLGVWKHLRREPSPEWFEDSLKQIVRQLKHQTTARIALCSLAPIGEDPRPADPVQRELNRRVEQYSAIIKRIASEESVRYVPFYERMREQIEAAPGRAFTEFKFLPIYRDAFRLLVLRWSVDEIAARNGWRLHTDGIHLNSRGGKILADLVQEFVGA